MELHWRHNHEQRKSLDIEEFMESRHSEKIRFVNWLMVLDGIFSQYPLDMDAIAFAALEIKMMVSAWLRAPFRLKSKMLKIAESFPCIVP